MQPRGTKLLRRLGGYGKRRFAGIVSAVARRSLHLTRRGLILCYHRVCDFRTDPQLLCVSPERFELQLRHLVANYEPVTLAEISHGRRARRTGGRPLVAVTFDDGYVDNYSIALPLLKKYSVPAVVFTCTGFIGTGFNFYWDEVFDLLMCMEIRQCHVREIFGPDVIDWFRGYSGGVQAGWDVLKNYFPSWRHACYKRLCERLRFLKHDTREALLNSLCDRANVDRRRSGNRRVMTLNELRSCLDSGVLDVGAHTVTHASLSSLTAEDLRAEVLGSKNHLESAGFKVGSFSYPYGDGPEISDSIAAHVAEAGFERVCINSPGLILAGSNTSRLPRFLVRDWETAEFAANLSRWWATPGPFRC